MSDDFNASFNKNTVEILTKLSCDHPDWSRERIFACALSAISGILSIREKELADSRYAHALAEYSLASMRLETAKKEKQKHEQRT